MGWIRMVTVLLVALLLASGGGRTARAEVITYRLDMVASGEIGARRFTDQPIVLLARADTDFAIEIAGLGFAIGAIMKFKQHKDNPTQIPIHTPIALFLISKELQLRPYTVQSPGALAAMPLPQPSGRLILRSSKLGPGKLLQATDPIAVTTDLAGALKLVLVRDHVPATLVIRSIKGNRAVLQAVYQIDIPRNRTGRASARPARP